MMMKNFRRPVTRALNIDQWTGRESLIVGNIYILQYICVIFLTFEGINIFYMFSRHSGMVFGCSSRFWCLYAKCVIDDESLTGVGCWFKVDFSVQWQCVHIFCVNFFAFIADRLCTRNIISHWFCVLMLTFKFVQNHWKPHGKFL